MIYTEKFPKNIQFQRSKIIYALHALGPTNRIDFRIKGMPHSSLRQTVIAEKAKGLIEQKGDLISLTEYGLKMYIQLVNTTAKSAIRVESVYDFVKQNGPVSSRDYRDVFGVLEPGMVSQVVRAFKRLRDNNKIIKHSNKGTMIFYVLSSSPAGEAILKKESEPGKPLNRLWLQFQKTLPGTLSVTKPKPYLY